MEYIRIAAGLNDRGTMIPYEELFNYTPDRNIDHYRSVFLYNAEHYKFFQANNTVAGITDVYTKSLVFDFDSADNPDQAQTDAIVLCKRLISDGLKQDEFIISYSGNKGISVELETDHKFTPVQVRRLASALAKDLPTFDAKIYNASRIFRIRNTKHNKSGLYKFPISYEDLCTLTIDQIKELAKLPSSYNPEVFVVTLPESVVALAGEDAPDKARTDGADLPELDFSKKGKVPACKFAILNGYFKPSNRSNSLMALAAHFHAAGFPREATKGALVGAAELQAKRFNQAPFSEDEIESKILSQVYGPFWKGATYACKDHQFLQELCNEYVPAHHRCSKKKEQLVSIGAVASGFREYAKNIEKNTVKTGIQSIDDNIRLQTNSHVILAGCSGAGKTSVVLNILRNASLAGSNGVFGSMDMGSKLIYQKLAHKVTRLDDKTLYKIYESNDEQKVKDIDAKIAKDYENIYFDFRSGVDIAELRENLLFLKDKHGANLKIAVYDFINRIRGPYSDDTANLAYIAPRLADLANETEMLIISLAQVARAKGGPATPLMDSRVAKGSSAIEESATVLFGIWRPGYNTQQDKFIRIAALKTRMGKEFSAGLGWNGLTGDIRELNDTESAELEMLENAEKDAKSSEGGW